MIPGQAASICFIVIDAGANLCGALIAFDLRRHHKMFVDRVEVEAGHGLRDEMKRRREELAKMRKKALGGVDNAN